MAGNRLFMFATLLLATACTSDPMAGGDSSATAQAAAQKIVNTPAAAAQGSLIIYFNNDASESAEQATATAIATRSAATRSGVDPVDRIFEQIGVISFRRVFPYAAKHEERTRAAGLHRWYVATFDEHADLEATASKLAAVAQIEAVQFNTQMERASDCKVTPLKDEAPLGTRAAASFNDPQLSRQWHYINTGSKTITTSARAGADMKAAEAWAVMAGDPRVIVAVVDEGVKYSHPDLAANMWVNTAEKNGAANSDDDGNGYKDDVHGLNFVTGGTISWNKPIIINGENKGDSGHGTHVAGTVSAVNNNNLGVCGVAGGTGKNDGVRIMSCQIFSGGDSGSGSAAVSAEAIKYAADNGASIIQCSFGYDPGVFASDAAYATSYTRVEKAAIDYFIATKNSDAIDGGLVIFASGNESKPIAGYPGAYRDYISVTSFSPDYLPAYYTNYGPGSNICAPGGDFYISANSDKSFAQVLSTITSEVYGADYGYMQGTSMACPHVSGVAALGLSYALAKGKTFTLEQFKAMLLTSVNDMEIYLDGTKVSRITMNLADYRKKLGTGAIDAYQLLMQVEGTPCLKLKTGTKQLLSLNKYFGGSASNLTYTKIEITPADMQRLGIDDAPAIQYGKLQIKTTKPGSAKIKITAIAGGDKAGNDQQMGGMPITQEFAIISRAVQSENGGWL